MTQSALLTIGALTVVVNFPEAPTAISDYESFAATDDIFGSIESDGQKIVMSFNSSDLNSDTLPLKIGVHTTIVSPHGGTAKVSGGDVTIESEGCTITELGADQIQINLENGTGSIEIRENQNLFSKLDVIDGTYVIAADSRMPEWSIGVFDDAAFLRPRPVRIGVPVISTVPVNGPGLTATDKELLLRGNGTDNRTMYFKIISNVAIPDGFAPSLIVRLPNGLDTVGDPISLEMVKLEDLSTDKNSVYSSSYTFEKEDTIRTVDGYVYFSIDLPIRVTVGIPYEFEVYTDIGTIWSFDTVDDPTLY